MSASRDYEELRRSRQERTLTQVHIQKRIAFVGCRKCGYFAGKEIPETEKADCICPNCGGQAVEV